MIFNWSLSATPELFSVFWVILVMLLSGWSLLFFYFSSFPVSVPILWGLFQVHQLQLVSLSPSCSIDFLKLSSNVLVLTSLFAFFYFILWSAETADSLQFLLLLIIIRSGRLAEIRWSISIWKSLKKSLYVTFSRTDSGLRIYHLFVWSNLNFKFLVIFLVDHLPHSVSSSLINFFPLISSLYDWSFCLLSPTLAILSRLIYFLHKSNLS